MRKRDEDWAKLYLSIKKNKNLVLRIMLLVVAVAVITTMYILHKSASALTSDSTGEVGMVLDTDSNDERNSETNEDVQTEDEQDKSEEKSQEEYGSLSQNDEGKVNPGNNEEQQENSKNDLASQSDSAVNEVSSDKGMSVKDASDSSSLESTDDLSNSSVSASSKDKEIKEQNKAIVYSLYVDKDGQIIYRKNGEDKSVLSIKDKLDLSKAPREIEGYKYLHSKIGDVKIKNIFKNKTVSDKSHTASTVDKEENSSFFYETEDATVAEIKEDTDICFVYQKQEERVKRIYSYQDSKVKVTAILEKPEALPDDAKLRVTPVTMHSEEYNYEAYMESLNNNSKAIAKSNDSKEIKYDETNTLLYDIAFFLDDNEIEPEAGSVKINVEFISNQLKENISAKEKDSVEIVHLPVSEDKKSDDNLNIKTSDITASDIKAEPLTNGNVDIDKEKASFELDSFSIVAFTTKTGVYVNPYSLQKGMDVGIDYSFGDAKYFGIVANEIQKMAHMDSNVATKKFYGDGGNITLGAYTGNNNPGVCYLGEVGCGIRVDRGNVYVPSKDAYKVNVSYGYRKITDLDTSLINSYIDQMNQKIAETSWQMYYQSDWNVYKTNTPDQNSTEVDISKSGDGTYYIATDDYFGKYWKSVQNGGLSIKKRKNQKIVFNISLEQVSIPRFYVEVTDGEGRFESTSQSGSAVQRESESIIFNMPYAKSVDTDGGVLGIFVAPYAEMKISGTSSGWAFVNKLCNNGNEWHCVWRNMPKDIPTPNLQKKTVPAKLIMYAQKLVDDHPAYDNQKYNFNAKQFKVDSNGNSKYFGNPIVVQNNKGIITFDFGNVEKEGDYYYRIYEEKGNDPECTYDNSVYLVHFKVCKKVEGNLTTYYVADNGPDFHAIGHMSNPSEASWSTVLAGRSYNCKEIIFYNYTSVRVLFKKMWINGGAKLPSPNEVDFKLYYRAEDDWQIKEVPKSILNKRPTMERTDTTIWKCQWTGLPSRINGKKVRYLVKETKIPQGYLSTTGEVNEFSSVANYSWANESNEAWITNIHYIKYTVNKKWENDSEKNRWDKVHVVLKWSLDGKNWNDKGVKLVDNNEVMTDRWEADLTANNNWSYTFENLPLGNCSGQTYQYKVFEYYQDKNGNLTEMQQYDVEKGGGNQVEGYFLVGYKDEIVDQDGNHQVTLTNASTSVTINKDWVFKGEKLDASSEKIKGRIAYFKLMSTSKANRNVPIWVDLNGDGKGDLIALSEENNFEATFNGLPVNVGKYSVAYYFVETDQYGNEITDNVRYFDRTGTATNVAGNCWKNFYKTIKLEYRCENTLSNYELPETGGKGTKKWHVVGIIMILISLTIFLVKSRSLREY
ncbi:Cna B-type domain-containing protein [Butyrivibrio sp. NC3005]|uniref:Cna B-type domain-containing protein n=1 Tax=Butyrivibrio sp. NC3005 TaxID=1280685 RepID=UPI000400516F|nr:Cna B-type domain-containing protein [Butyrivibrio sp. NC3005]